ncbi:MAG: molybdopterin molybdotransferase MoeA [Syntrophomonas sp.]
MLKDISFEEAQQQINTQVSSLAAEELPLDQLIERVLAKDLIAPRPLPNCGQSAVDGFALGSEADPASNQFVVKGRLELGEIPDQGIGPGEALGVMTGGLLPLGCVGVVPHERTVLQGEHLSVLEQVKTNQNIKQAGEDFSEGEVLLKSGGRLDPGSIALMAAYGITSTPVFRKPRVAVLAMGRNVADYRENPQTGQTRDANSPLLGALIRQDGGIPGSSLLVAGKSSLEISDSLEALLGDADVLITSGGTYTRGEDDLIRVVEQIDLQMIFWGVNIMPGSHLGMARRGNQFIVLLSGNPTACFVGYHLFTAPILHIMQGLPGGLSVKEAVCINGFAKKSGSRRFVRGRAQASSQGWEVEILPGQKPSMIRSMLGCNALIDVPAGNRGITSGEKVSIIPLNRFRGL